MFAAAEFRRRRQSTAVVSSAREVRGSAVSEPAPPCRTVVLAARQSAGAKDSVDQAIDVSVVGRRDLQTVVLKHTLLR